jgi:hypothetical protein
MTKKRMADWWEETHSSSDTGYSDPGGFGEGVEGLYAKLGKEPAVDVSIEIIRKEMAAVYRDMRTGRIDCQIGTRLAYVLDLIRKSHETTVMRDKLGVLEKAVGASSDGTPSWLGLPFGDAGPK